MKPHIAPSIDFHKKVKITSNPQDQDPGFLLQKLKVNKFNHMKYEHALFANTKKKLTDLFRHAGKPETAYQKHVIDNLHDFKKFDNEVITTQNRLKMSKSQPRVTADTELRKKLSYGSIYTDFVHHVSDKKPETLE